MDTAQKCRALTIGANAQSIATAGIQTPSAAVSNPSAVLYGASGALAEEIVDELHAAQAAFPPFNSAHEGYAVIAEELDELWQEVQRNKGGTRVTLNAADMRKEAIQVAAMAMRYVLDVCERG